MDIVEESFTRLFPDAEFGYEAAVSYSGKFKPYNATVRRIGIRLFFSFSHSWMGVSDEIVIGLVQHLLVKILKKKGASTLNMQLYDDFIRGISDVAAVSNDNDEALESSFARVNERYFLGLSEKPNLRWGSGSFRKLASYDYHVNAITISSLFRDAPQHILDYLTYHELLHKKLKFRSSSGMTRHHGAEFRSLERAFEGSVTIDNEINAFIRGRNIKNNGGRRFNWKRILALR